ncbi:tetratricopeptide repeat protein [Candidatus Parabeggiatoa sp. HSG14]|uniref:tetratricopeptide repeat protein n=1 Tax=Candidatus Parabeggiatoa sp. HSG14 TaxID=3055593 RepID=UPI0025A6A23A|nr:tetratricopeptide repeat protein [Thiotrichales bacterium HSG14]
MNPELNLEFPKTDSVIVHFNDRRSDVFDFASPLSDEDKKDISWYLEVYGVHYTFDIDDSRAHKIANKLAVWGQDLFKAIFRNRSAQRLYEDFLKEENRLLTISANYPEILSLPWELLFDPESTFLCHDDPPISIRRRLAIGDRARQPFVIKPKNQLRVLFVVSRPTDASFIDPRADAMGVLNALDEEGSGRFTVEFLRPATLEHLVKRLECRGKYRRFPAVDIVHFDGHGVFDTVAQSDNSTQTVGTTKKESGDENFMGYLLFENNNGSKHLVDAEKLGNMLNQKKVGLVVLSACQSAAVAGGDPMSSVAVRLIHAQLPAVLAMTHSVLVATTRQLFAAFYEALAYGAGIGEALDDARRDLYMKPERGKRQRADKRITLKLQDWFLPALYQIGNDTPLLQEESESESGVQSTALSPFSNLPKIQEAGFFGRTPELWAIERAFITHKTRRLTISGFGGQGKTYLAIEAGQWLCRTGLFERVCFVDYASFQGEDAVGLAVSTLATVLDKSLVDVVAANNALQTIATLLILDNLEAIKSASLQELLTVAREWSEIGNCRVLLTTRAAKFHRPDYAVQGSFQHQALPLAGLAAGDALSYFQRLLEFPPAPQYELPERAQLLENFFKPVDFHPLSIGLIARQLKRHRAASLGMRLEELVAETPDNPLLASLNLSLDKLDERTQQWLPKLAVFQGGAMEKVLLSVTGLANKENPEVTQARQLLVAMQNKDYRAIARISGKNIPNNEEVPAVLIQHIDKNVITQKNIDEFSAMVAAVPQDDGIDESTWTTLRQDLEATGLIQAEQLVVGTYLKFHPTLAPALWTRLNTDEQAQLQAKHRQQYYQLSGYLYDEDKSNSFEIRPIALRELPNLLFSVHNALDTGEEYALEFVDKLNKFLNHFGFKRDCAILTQRMEQSGKEKVGSQTWFLARFNEGEQLFSVGKYQEAMEIFVETLKGLGELPTYEHCLTLGKIGQCLSKKGQSKQAVECYHQELVVLEKLEYSDDIKREIGIVQTDLANALTDIGDYDGAKKAYESAIVIDEVLRDFRGAAVDKGQLGNLAMLQGNLQEAEKLFIEVIATFQQLNEPEHEAISFHQLGMVYEKAKQWNNAEQAYRESVRIEELQGNLAGAAQTWNQLALVTKGAGKLEEAEIWYRKAIEGGKKVGDEIGVSKRLSNLAILLKNNDNRLVEAQQLAEQALIIKKTLDPAVATIWIIYNTLAEIAEKQHDTTKASEYRRQSREAYQAFQGAQYHLKEYESFIQAVVSAVDNAEVRKELESGLEQIPKVKENLVVAIHHILDGERDEDVLCEPLGYEDGAIVSAILQRIA